MSELPGMETLAKFVFRLHAVDDQRSTFFGKNIEPIRSAKPMAWHNVLDRIGLWVQKRPGT